MLDLRLKIVLTAGWVLAIASKFTGSPLQDEENYGKEREVQVKGADYESERIIHGKPAVDGMFPWTVALYEDDFFKCTGSIISETAVLTAAHCVNTGQDPLPVGILYGIIGSINRSAYEAKRIKFRKITTHPKNVFMHLVNDVAILETMNPIIFNNRIQPICLADKNANDLVNQPVIIMGWGLYFRGDNSYPEMLQWDVQIIAPNDHCSRLYGYNFPDTKLCITGFNEEYSGVCIGDSGGPLVYYDGNRPFQVGIISHGDADAGCGSPLGLDVSSRISAYTDFIKSAATGRICFQSLSTSY